MTKCHDIIRIILRYPIWDEERMVRSSSLRQKPADEYTGSKQLDVLTSISSSMRFVHDKVSQYHTNHPTTSYLGRETNNSIILAETEASWSPILHAHRGRSHRGHSPPWRGRSDLHARQTQHVDAQGIRRRSHRRARDRTRRKQRGLRRHGAQQGVE